jgi:hypothetical protein
MTELACVILGFFLGHFSTWWQQRRAVQLRKEGLGAEINLCERKARVYLNDNNIPTPLYRLPTFVFPESLPILLGSLKGQAVEDLESFAVHVQDINRGLDAAQRAFESGELDRLAKEASRLKLKCHDLLNAHGPDAKYEAYVTRARRALGVGTEGSRPWAN